MRRIHSRSVVLAAFLLTTSCILGFDKLPEAASDEAKRLAVVFDFDTDSCYPSPAVSKDGQVNGGLRPTGDITGDCRNPEQLGNSNSYYRKASITKNGVEYAVHMYALYFMKDQWAQVAPPIPLIGDEDQPGGHRHDWEFALVWTKGGELTHASVSAHGGLATWPKDRLIFDDEKKEHVRVVYHKDDIKTHAFRFGGDSGDGDPQAENALGRWVTPTILDWHMMKSDTVSNAELRRKFNQYDFGAANCPFNDKNFTKEIAKGHD